MNVPSENNGQRVAVIPQADWLVGGGEMGELIRSIDWAETPLGPIETWPHSFRTTVSLCLSSNFPINIVWGPRYNQIYNDSYRAIVGERHPEAMGMAYNECWASAWPAVGVPFERGWAGEASFLENQRMYLTRNGYMEETFFTFSLSPIRDENGVIAGLFHPVIETTVAMLSERRTRSLRELGQNTGEARNLESAFVALAQTLGAHQLDLPFVLLYKLDEHAKKATLIDTTGIGRGLAASPESLSSKRRSWPLSEIVKRGETVQIDDLKARFGDFQCGPYPEGVDTALARTLLIPGSDIPIGIIILGVSPRLPLDDSYRNYLNQVTVAASVALGNALAYEQERKRAEALAEIDRAKSQFFANVSHEFRTPLALMLGPIDNVLSSAEDQISEDNRGQICIVRRNSLRLLRLMNALLDYSRIVAGRAQASFEPADLSGFTADLAAAFRSMIESAGMELNVNCSALGEDIYVDREMWEKIVLNLLSNAYKFTMQGKIQVELTLAGETVQLTVADTGSGIPKEQIAHVFERFHRIEGAQGRTHEGSGIGLALVDEFARLHQGSASVESELGVGSTFTVTIPRGSGHLPAEQIVVPRSRVSSALRPEVFTEEASRWQGISNERQEERALALPETVSTSLKPFRILLAEDNRDMRDYIKRVIGSDYDIMSVSNGKEALSTVKAYRPDMLISDVMMPRMDGFALVKALRSDPDTQGLSIILLSAQAGEEARSEGIETGADDYLVKPFSPRELKARVHTHLELQALRREMAVQREQLHIAGILRESEKLAVVGRLASSIAHEINNPLEAITNLLYLLQGSEQDPELRNYIVQAQEELARVSNIATQTLRFHHQSTKPQETHLSDILDGVLQLFKARILNAGVLVKKQFEDETPLYVFAADLRQVFANFIGNALDASDAGGKLVLRLHRSVRWSDGRSGMRVVIADTGHGMTDAVRSRIFEPFSRQRNLLEPAWVSG